MSITVTDSRQQLERLVETSLQACKSWLGEDIEGGLRVIDPVDDEAIVSHYGDSHLAAALVILGQIRNDSDMFNQGLRLVRTVVRDWQTSLMFGDFHHDFNNFALCLIEECLKGVSSELPRDIRKLVLSTPDSSHDTINWLPMRAYANRSRYDWTGEKRYLEASHRSLETIRRATNDDGGIEDRLPVGSSYNLQYNVSSLAALQLMSRRWPSLGLDLGRGLDFLLGCVLPDGDINYMGRGTNQIFAWGPWLYATSFAEKDGALKSALGFLSDRYARAAHNKNILLNDFPGREKSFWARSPKTGFDRALQPGPRRQQRAGTLQLDASFKERRVPARRRRVCLL